MRPLLKPCYKESICIRIRLLRSAHPEGPGEEENRRLHSVAPRRRQTRCLQRRLVHRQAGLWVRRRRRVQRHVPRPPGEGTGVEALHRGTAAHVLFCQQQVSFCDFPCVPCVRVSVWMDLWCRFMPPDDPLGRYGPTLENFLRRYPKVQKKQLCPYGESLLNIMICLSTYVVVGS